MCDTACRYFLGHKNDDCRKEVIIVQMTERPGFDTFVCKIKSLASENIGFSLEVIPSCIYENALLISKEEGRRSVDTQTHPHSSSNSNSSSYGDCNGSNSSGGAKEVTGVLSGVRSEGACVDKYTLRFPKVMFDESGYLKDDWNNPKANPNAHANGHAGGECSGGDGEGVSLEDEHETKDSDRTQTYYHQSQAHSVRPSLLCTEREAFSMLKIYKTPLINHDSPPLTATITGISDLSSLPTPNITHMLTFSIACFNLNCRTYNFRLFADLIITHNFDVICLNECDVDLAERISAVLKCRACHYEYAYAAADWSGNAIFTKFKIIEQKGLQLYSEHSEVRSAVCILVDVPMPCSLSNEEERETHSQCVNENTATTQIWFIGTHLCHINENSRLDQFQCIITEVGDVM